MHTLLETAGGAQPASVVALLAGTIVGVLIRIVIARLTGPDPRKARVWIAELVVIGVIAIVVALPPASVLAGPGIGAGLTTYAGASGAFGYLGARDVKTNPRLYGVGHFVATLLLPALIIVGLGYVVPATG